MRELDYLIGRAVSGLFHAHTDTAAPAPYFAVPPYRAERFHPVDDTAGVVNANGVNCLTFSDRPGAVLSDFETCSHIAAAWNKRG